MFNAGGITAPNAVPKAIPLASNSPVVAYCLAAVAEPPNTPPVVTATLVLAPKGINVVGSASIPVILPANLAPESSLGSKN